MMQSYTIRKEEYIKKLDSSDKFTSQIINNDTKIIKMPIKSKYPASYKKMLIFDKDSNKNNNFLSEDSPRNPINPTISALKKDKNSIINVENIVKDPKNKDNLIIQKLGKRILDLSNQVKSIDEVKNKMNSIIKTKETEISKISSSNQKIKEILTEYKKNPREFELNTIKEFLKELKNN